MQGDKATTSTITITIIVDNNNSNDNDSNNNNNNEKYRDFLHKSGMNPINVKVYKETIKILSISICVTLSVFVSVAGFWAHMTLIRPPGDAEHLPHPANCVMRNMLLIPFSYSLHQTLSLAKYFAQA